MTIENAIDELTKSAYLIAAVDDYDRFAGLINIESLRHSNSLPVAEMIEKDLPDEVRGHLEWVESDESANEAWYRFEA